MSCSPFFETVRGVARAERGGRDFVLRFTHDGQSTDVGPLPEYSARGELARLGFAGVDIDRWIEGDVTGAPSACETATG